jgi:succinate dehydrogenase/fumarate reductase flavoprotein subunit
VLVDKAKVSKSGCSPFAAGIYNAVFPEDDPDLWMKEVIESGDFLADQEWVKLQAQTGFTVVQLMDEWGKHFNLPIFEKDDQARFQRRKSRGHVHSSHCIINALPMMEAMRRKAAADGVQIIDRSMITDLLLADGAALGAAGFDCRTGQIMQFLARAVILAAGGCSFKSIFVGHKNLTGDAQAAALRAGALFRSMEQTNSNTCYRGFDIHGMNLMVNVGGRFLNGQGDEFMWKYSPKLGNRALLPELVLAFCHEVKAGRGPIYLDVTSAKPEDQKLCRKILPETFRAWDRSGINPFQTKVEWVPAFGGTRGTSGGVEIDTQTHTSIANLFAAGDATAVAPASAGLGGIPLAYASVSGYQAGEAAGKLAAAGPDIPKDVTGWEEVVSRFVSPLLKTKGVLPDKLIYDLQSRLFPYDVCYLKSRPRLIKALTEIDELKNQLTDLWAPDIHQLVKANEAVNMLLIAEAILRSALFREESRCYHFREDYPLQDNKNWLKWVTIKLEEGQFNLATKDIPTPYCRPSEEYSRPKGTKVAS